RQDQDRPRLRHRRRSAARQPGDLQQPVRARPGARHQGPGRRGRDRRRVPVAAPARLPLFPRILLLPAAGERPLHRLRPRSCGLDRSARPGRPLPATKAPRMTASARFFPFLAAGTLGLALAACSSSPKVSPTAPVAVATQAEDIEAIAQLLDTGQVKEARKRLDRALRSDPMNPSLLVLRQGLEGDARADLGSTSYPYTVAPGDTMNALAERFLGNRLKSYQLARYNGLDDPAALAPGQVIQIPGQPPRAAPQRPAATAAPARAPSARRASPPSRTPPAASAAPRPPAADTAGAQRARTAGLAAL